MNVCPLAGCDLNHEDSQLTAVSHLVLPYPNHGDYVRLCITCPHHPVLLVALYTCEFYAQANPPYVSVERGEGFHDRYVANATDTEAHEGGHLLSPGMPVVAGPVISSHVDTHLKCPRPSCGLRAVYSTTYECERLAPLVRRLWDDGHRGNVLMTTAQVGI